MPISEPVYGKTDDVIETLMFAYKTCTLDWMWTMTDGWTSVNGMMVG